MWVTGEKRLGKLSSSNFEHNFHLQYLKLYFLCVFVFVTAEPDPEPEKKEEAPEPIKRIPVTFNTISDRNIAQ